MALCDVQPGMLGTNLLQHCTGGKGHTVIWSSHQDEVAGFMKSG